MSFKKRRIMKFENIRLILSLKPLLKEHIERL